MRRSLLAACTATTALLTAVPLAMTPTPALAKGGSNEPWVVRKAVMRADAKEFKGLCGKQKDGVPEVRTWRLFRDTPPVTAVRDYYRKDDSGTVYWDGYDPKNPEDTVSLSIIGACSGGRVTLDGVIEVGTRDYLFTPNPKRPGEYCLEEIDTLKLPPSGQGVDTVTGNLPKHVKKAPRKAPRADASNPVAIDIVVPYTPATVTELGGVTEVEARIRYGVSQMNKALAITNVPASVHVVHSYQTLPSGVTNEDANTLLSKLNNPFDVNIGVPARAARELYGADLVALLASIPGRFSSGAADLPSVVTSQTSGYAYSVTSVLSVKDWDNLGHELGHNLGMQHDRATVIAQGGTPAPGASNFGWITADNAYHTLMAYSTPCRPTCRVINQYSNTINTVNGQALGNAQNNNAGVAQLATPLVADYRASKVTNRSNLSMQVAPEGGGTVSVSEFGPYDPGTQVTVTAKANPGWVFAGWEVDGQEVDDATTQYQITMDENHTVIARFNQV
ncbi:reprolysin-like metallopeptidase [Streptomyces sp. NPDC058964]|uniref:InlB B-repeat-containing protein n=1 Tax=Streptomyces sp. NPDC058964 TaxID=3346681 RepID=UPI0036AA559E